CRVRRERKNESDICCPPFLRTGTHPPRQDASPERTDAGGSVPRCRSSAAGGVADRSAADPSPLVSTVRRAARVRPAHRKARAALRKGSRADSYGGGARRSAQAIAKQVRPPREARLEP